MSTVNSEIRFAVQAPSYITSNPSKVLANGEPIFFNNGTYVFGDGTTALNALTVYGSSAAWGSITGTLSNQTDLQNALNAKQNTITTGTTAQYFRGDLSLATFPTNVSSFTNDSGYITSAALSPYLTSATAAATYQPIGSYLTSSAIGVTVQGYSANTTLLGNSTTGSGSIVLATSPTFGTSIFSPIVYGSSSASGTLTIDSTSDSTKGAINFGTASSENVYNFNIGSSSALVRISGRVGATSQAAIYFNQSSPAVGNAALYGLNTTTVLNCTGGGTVNIANGGSTLAAYTNTGITWTPPAVASGAITSIVFTLPTNTGQTASTNIPNFRVNGSTKTWAAGTITNQYWNYFTANTAAFASPSTITNSYGLFVEAATAGTNATITNNWAAGFNGGVEINGQVNIIGGTTLLLNNASGINVQNVGSDRKWASSRTGGNTIFINHTTTAFQFYNNDTAQVLFSINTATGGADIYGNLTMLDAKNIVVNTGTGTKIATATTQKIGFWNATPIVQPTTAVTAATYAAVGGTTVQTNDTFDGYTVGQVVKALRNAGLLA